MPNERLPIIRASELGEYVFCARAWWLRRALGWEPEGHARREYGTLLHRRHGRALAGPRLVEITESGRLSSGDRVRGCHHHAHRI